MDARISAFLAGDRRAGQSLLLEFLPRVRNVVRALLGRDSDIDDIAQQVMVEVIRGLAGYRGEGTLVGWVDRITVRVALAHARKTRSRGAVERPLLDEEPGGELLEFRPAGAERYVEKRQAVRALDQLPLPQKSAVVLHHVLGFTVGEIATQEQIPVETVRSRLRLGLQKLRDAAGTDQRTAGDDERVAR